MTTRDAVIAEARSWIGTPYAHAGRIKGAGVDCATLLAEVFAAVGLIPALEIDSYPPDWHLHRGEERYRDRVLAHAHEISHAEAQPGDVALFQWGRTFAHGAILMPPGWPRIVHAWMAAGFVIEDRGDGGKLAGREVKFFSLFEAPPTPFRGRCPQSTKSGHLSASTAACSAC